LKNRLANPCVLKYDFVVTAKGMGKAKLSHLIVFGLFFVLISGGITPGYAQTENAVSAFPIIVDGDFTSAEEWSDVTPLAFISPDTNEGTLFQTTLDDTDANAFTYAAIAPSELPPIEDLYLMYDYLPRTEPFFPDGDMAEYGEFVADIFFPITITTFIPAYYLPGIPESMQAFAGIEPPEEEEVDITIQVRVPETTFGPACPDETGLFDVFITDGAFIPNAGSVCALEFGIGVAVGFGPSPQGDIRGAGIHLLVELEVPLLIDESFADPGGPIAGGVPGFGCASGPCGYSPDPAFWGASVANDLVDPPASAAVFTITPFGGTIVTSVASSLMAVGGDLIPLDTTMVLVAGAQTSAAWMIPVIVSAAGFGLVLQLQRTKLKHNSCPSCKLESDDIFKLGDKTVGKCDNPKCRVNIFFVD